MQATAQTLTQWQSRFDIFRNKFFANNSELHFNRKFNTKRNTSIDLFWFFPSAHNISGYFCFVIKTYRFDKQRSVHCQMHVPETLWRFAKVTLSLIPSKPLILWLPVYSSSKCNGNCLHVSNKSMFEKFWMENHIEMHQIVVSTINMCEAICQFYFSAISLWPIFDSSTVMIFFSLSGLSKIHLLKPNYFVFTGEISTQNDCSFGALATPWWLSFVYFLVQMFRKMTINSKFRRLVN